MLRGVVGEEAGIGACPLVEVEIGIPGFLRQSARIQKDRLVGRDQRQHGDGPGQHDPLQFGDQESSAALLLQRNGGKIAGDEEEDEHHEQIEVKADQAQPVCLGGVDHDPVACHAVLKYKSGVIHDHQKDQEGSQVVQKIYAGSHFM